MNKEIRKEIREYILDEVNVMLTRLGVSENVQETREFEEEYNGTLHYEFETPAIKLMPMMFKKAYVDGSMVAIDIKDEDDRYYAFSQKNDIIVVNLYYRWNSFGGGSNGTELGRAVFAVSKTCPIGSERS